MSIDPQGHGEEEADLGWHERPEAPIERWMRPLVHFLEIESASGLILLACTALALALANSPWSEGYTAFWEFPLGFTIGEFRLIKPLLLWVNDGLMTIFFFVIGLEIKRELVAGELRDPRKAALPAAAALGGMLVPAAIYLALRGGREGASGWGIPMATDIAFVVGFLTLLGPRVPSGLKILLLSLAIVDDLGAVLVIALFYTEKISLAALAMALAGFGIVALLRVLGVRRVAVYVFFAAVIWLAFLKSGIHPTIAGVALGLMTPATRWFSDPILRSAMHDVERTLTTGAAAGHDQDRHLAIGQLAVTAREMISPLERLEVALHPWVAFLIMPVFALANAGVLLAAGALLHPVSLAVSAGLVLGKPLGILLFSAAAVQLGIARLPAGVDWKVLFGAGCLAGIGFTMSLFIAGLALEGDLLQAGKIGTLLGSLVSAVLGLGLLLAFLPNRAAAASTAGEEL